MIDNEDKFDESPDKKIMMNALPAKEKTYFGPYTIPAKKNWSEPQP